jgi:hypothetical protein
LAVEPYHLIVVYIPKPGQLAVEPYHLMVVYIPKPYSNPLCCKGRALRNR